MYEYYSGDTNYKNIDSFGESINRTKKNYINFKNWKRAWILVLTEERNRKIAHAAVTKNFWLVLNKYKNIPTLLLHLYKLFKAIK